MDKQFLNGIRVFKPNEKAPEWIVANLEIDTHELIRFLQSQPVKVRADLKRSKEGKFYLEVNNWQPKESNNAAASQASKEFYAPPKSSVIDGPATQFEEPTDILPF